jgi:hypothetical protein
MLPRAHRFALALALVFLGSGVAPAQERPQLMNVKVGGHAMRLEMPSGWRGQAQQAAPDAEWAAAFARLDVVVYLTVLPTSKTPLDKAVEVLAARMPKQFPELTTPGEAIVTTYNGFPAKGRWFHGEEGGQKILAAGIVCEAGPLTLFIMLRGPDANVKQVAPRVAQSFDKITVDGQRGTAAPPPVAAKPVVAPKPKAKTHRIPEPLAGGTRIEGAYFAMVKPREGDAAPQQTWLIFTKDGYLLRTRPPGWAPYVPPAGTEHQEPVQAYRIQGGKLETLGPEGEEETRAFQAQGKNRFKLDGTTFDRVDIAYNRLKLAGRYYLPLDAAGAGESGQRYLEFTRAGRVTTEGVYGDEKKVGKYRIRGSKLTITWEGGGEEHHDFFTEKATLKDPKVIYLDERMFAK